MRLTRWMAIGLACGLISVGSVRATDTPGKSAATGDERIGIYDSRAIAYAEFWTEAHQRKISEMVKAAKAAKNAGETERLRKLETELKAEQERNHLQVFSTAPVEAIMAGMKDRVEAIQKEAGVSQLVSKWDDKTLKDHARAEQVDVTDLLLRGFTLNEKQQKVVADLRAKKPLALKEAEKLMREGKL